MRDRLIDFYKDWQTLVGRKPLLDTYLNEASNQVIEAEGLTLAMGDTDVVIEALIPD